MRWLAANTWLMVLVPLVVVLLLSDYTGKPFQLLKESEVDYLNNDTLLTLHLLSHGQDCRQTMRYEASVAGGGRVLLYLQKDSLAMPSMGDVLLTQTTVRRGGMLGDFDYGLYLRRQGIVGTCWVHRGNWQVIGHQKIKGIKAVAQKCQQYLHDRYKTLGITGQELAILSALTLGYREEMDSNVERAFSASGAMHVLSVSGLHTAIVWGIVMWVLTLGGLRTPLYEERVKRWLLTVCAILLIWAYAFVTGMCPSVMRSALMLSFVSLSYTLSRHSSPWNALFASAVIILLINPLALWSISFQLSFVAIGAIMLVVSRVQSRMIVSGWLWQQITNMLIISFAAQLGTMPLTLYYFGQTSNYFALTNLLVVELANWILKFGLGALALSWCVVGDWLGLVAQWGTWLMREIVEWVETLPYATTHIALSAISTLCCYGFLACALLMLRGKRVHWWWLVGVVGCAAATLAFNQ